MANMKNAKKRVLVNEKKEARNNMYSASMKTACKNVERSIANKDKEKANENLKTAIKRIIIIPYRIGAIFAINS